MREIIYLLLNGVGTFFIAYILQIL